MLPILADTITAFVATDFAYLFILNAIIGWVEGKLLKRWFSGGRRAVWWMIAANYLSAWIGFMGFIWLVEPRVDGLLGSRPIERVNLLAAGMALISFVITVGVEFGFVYLAREQDKRSTGHAFWATICVNAISYLAICLFFIWSSYSLPLNAHITQLSELGSLPHGTLYWVDPTGGVISKDSNRIGPDRKIGQVVQNDRCWPYQLRIDQAANLQRVQMSVMYSGFDTFPETGTVLVPDAGPLAAFPADYLGRNRILRKTVLDLRPEDHRATQVTFDWYRHYLNTDVPGGPNSYLSVALAIFDWQIQEPTVLPDDKIVFELNRQIVIFDPYTRKLAFVALGTCPAFVPD